jgi:zinc protease
VFQFVKLIVAASALALSSPSLAQTANGWGIPTTDVPADPRIQLGTLPNGMRYAILKNATPKGTASFRLRFGFGSIHEGENEQGLAHFIEHMAFNGTTNVPEGDMRRILERQGLAFGPDTNAQTNFESTTYMLDLPVADVGRLDTAFFLLRETASEVKFDAAAVNRERGVILGERRARDGFQIRQFMDQLSFIVPQGLMAKRLPIGTLPVLNTATADTMKALYHRYYRPENATMVIVGDIDPKDIEARIKAKFGDWKGVGPAGAKPQRGRIDLTRPRGIDTFLNANVASAVQLTTLRPWEDPDDTIAERRRQFVRSIGTAIVSRRLTRLANTSGSPLLNSSIGNSAVRELAMASSINVVTRDGAWADGLAAARTELRRALQHGFTPLELKREMARAETSSRLGAEQAATRRSEALAGLIVGTIDDREFVTDPAWRWNVFFKQVAPTVTLDEVNAEFRKLWQGSAPLIHVSDKTVIAPAAIASAFDAANRVAVTAPSAEADKAFAYESFGTPGKVVEDRMIADLGIRTIRFANNVRLNLKKTDFEAGRVRYSVRMAGGQLAIPRSQPGLAIMMSSMSAVAGTARHSVEELKEILAGKTYSLGMQVADDAFVTSGSTTRADLALQMQLNSAYLTDPGYRAEAADRWANMVPIIDKQVGSQPQSVMSAKVMATLAGNDYRFGLPPAADLTKRNFAEAQAVLEPLIANAPIEIALVGDVDEAAAIDAIARTFGALPQRSAEPPAFADARQASLDDAQRALATTHSGLVDQAMVAAIWPTDDDDDYRREIGMALLANTLDLMLSDKIREELGASYGVEVSSSMSDIYDGFGIFSVSSVVAPGRIDEVLKAIDASVAELRDRPVSDDLLSRARNPVLESIIRSRRENSWWLGIASEAQGKADRLDRIRQQEALYKAITPAELQALAKQYLVSSTERRVEIRGKPMTARIPIPTTTRSR